jgi:fatty acid desaturase
VETQVADRPRNKNAIGWEAADLRVTAADESRTASAIVVWAIIVWTVMVWAIMVCEIMVWAIVAWAILGCRGALRHVYKIVCRAKIL